jgi:hypothetical protein
MATESGTGTGPESPTTTTTTEAEVTTTTATTEEPTTTTTTVDSTEEDFNSQDEAAAQEKAFEDAVAAGRNTEVEEPADDHILGDNETTHGELLANARAEALANHEAEHAE